MTKEAVTRPTMTSLEAKQDKSANRKNAFKKQEDHRIDITWMDSSGTDSSIRPPPPPPFPLLPSERIIADPILPLINPSGRTIDSVNSVKTFTIASLQQYTDSFSQENLVGKGMLGTVYKAKLPNGKVSTDSYVA